MHLTVGYLATPTGDDGVALASALAKTFDARVDVALSTHCDRSRRRRTVSTNANREQGSHGCPRMEER